MSLPLILACLWAVVANVIAMFPSRDNHWRNAYILIAIGIPILVAIGYRHGVLLALLVMVAGMSILRWPMIYLMRWLRGLLSGKGRSL
ncbi:DUF2484 family protein [Aliishimia ponticola]|uniref:DUF2484 family protein n=1 Tax=Aliishimia ponticola TaxID=2499833 RepID=A0A4S4NHA0_9RHOB|nr:DUF2484 family protein [Aliishimia ponticola]THH39056.1 DUF2484 family protein [Aliishimia ponticola]